MRITSALYCYIRLLQLLQVFTFTWTTIIINLALNNIIKNFLLIGLIVFAFFFQRILKRFISNFNWLFGLWLKELRNLLYVLKLQFFYFRLRETFILNFRWYNTLLIIFLHLIKSIILSILIYFFFIYWYLNLWIIILFEIETSKKLFISLMF